MNIPCLSCDQKQNLIKKYEKLIRLLKTKCEKTKSLLKNQTLGSEINFQPSQEITKSVQSYKRQYDKQLSIKIVENSAKMSQKKLALVVIQKKTKKYLLKHIFMALKSAAKISIAPDTFSFGLCPPLKTDTSKLKDFIEETLTYGTKLQTSNQSNLTHFKQLHFKVFQSELKNSQFAKKIKRLEKQLSQFQKRYIKQTQKKRESLQTVAQEIRQKCQLVFQLQQLVKRYQKTLGKSLQKISVENVLIEDEQQLKKTCQRLQSINDKINIDLKRAQIEIERLNNELSVLNAQDQQLNVQNKCLRQKNFDLSQQVSKHGQLGDCYKSLCQKLTKKIDKLKTKQKQIHQSVKVSNKCNQLFSSTDIVSSKNTQASLQSPLSRKGSVRQFHPEMKIEEIFSFIFNIEVEHYRIMNEQVFDKDELLLLKTHKDSYLNNRNSRDSQIEVKTQTIIRKDQLDQTDLVFYRQSARNDGQNSFLNVMQPMKMNTKTHESPTSTLNNIRLINLEIQKSKLIQKISELKNLHMHIRNVFLNFLKTLDLSSTKNQTQSIMQVIFEFFQYSEDQKLSICKEKRKKFWGIL